MGYIKKAVQKSGEELLLQNTYPEHVEEIHLLDIITPLIIKIDQQTQQDLTGTYPTIPTLRYMKRRIRRFLRKLYMQNPDSYTFIAKRLIRSYELHTELDYGNHWVVMDVLFGKSKRCYQKAHGQGSYVYNAHTYHLHYSEPYYPDVWENSPEFLSGLLQKPMAWEFYDFAIKILYKQAPLPDFSDKQLRAFFNSPSIWLRRIAAQYTYLQKDNRKFPAFVQAGSWFYGNQAQRTQWSLYKDNASLLPKQNKKRYELINLQLQKLVVTALQEGNTSKRVIDAMQLLQKNLTKQRLQPSFLLTLLPILSKSKHPIFADWLFTQLEGMQLGQGAKWLGSLAKPP